MSEADPAGLRTAMVDGIVDWWRGIGGSPPLNPRVLQAMQTVARHEFAPAAELAAAYALDTVPLKHGPGGRMVSCLSNPSIVAVMLHQLDARPGQRVLEIGAGGGYQAALLAELVAPGGRVTTVDIDPDIAATARRNLTAAGYGDTDVTVQAGNGAAALRGGVFDRVIAAVGPWDLPTAWVQQLVEGGRMVVPLRLRGSSRLLALTRRRDRLVCDDVQMGGFVPMAGPGQGGEQHATIHDPGRDTGHDGGRAGGRGGGAATLFWDAGQPVQPDALYGVLCTAPRTVWSGVHVGRNEPYDRVWLHLLAAEPGLCAVELGEAVEDPAARPAIGWRNPCLVEENSLAYLAIRQGPAGSGPAELGAVGHGPRGSLLADRICRQVRAWATDRRAVPAITVYPAGTPDRAVGDGVIVDRPSVRIVVRWPGVGRR